MAEKMRAVEITEAGGPDVLQMCERSRPVAQHGQVVLKVAYAGVNRPDCLQRAGLYAPPPTASDLPGLEASGEVVEVGPGAEGLSVGDQVCALLPGGGYAEFVATPAAHCLPIPVGMSMKEAACLPETFLRSGPTCSRAVDCRVASGSWCMGDLRALARRPFSSPVLLGHGSLPRLGPRTNAKPAQILGLKLRGITKQMTSSKRCALRAAQT